MHAGGLCLRGERGGGAGRDLEVGGEDGGGACGGVEDGWAGVGLLELEDPCGPREVPAHLRQALRLAPAEGRGGARVAQVRQAGHRPARCCKVRLRCR
jgi:hypothetical protein